MKTISEIVSKVEKVTIWNTTASVKDGKITHNGKNTWAIALFMKGNEKGLLSQIADGVEVSEAEGKLLKGFVKTLHLTDAVVAAKKFADEYGLKVSSTVGEAYERCLKIQQENAEADEKEKAFRDKHPELAGMRKLQERVEKTKKVADKSNDMTFKAKVAAIDKVARKELDRLEALYKAELDAAQKEMEQTMADATAETETADERKTA